MTNGEACAPRVVIVGGGTAGWMAASLMWKRWQGRAIELSVLESPEIGIVGVGEGSTPQLHAFFEILGIEEAEWMPRCHATYKTAIRSVGWSTRPGHESYFHPFKNDLDDRSAPAYYFNTVMRRRQADVYAHPDRFFINTALAERRLAPLPEYRFPFRAYYGYHFDAFLIGAFLRDWSTARGVRHLQGTVQRVEQGAAGDIERLHLADGRAIEADFFVDATGFRSLLLQQTLGIAFVPFAENLFNDSAIAMPTPHQGAGIAPHTTATALSAGWAWHIPLTNRVGNGYVYSSRYLDKDQAETEFRAHLGTLESDVQARHLAMRVGRVTQPWARNCLAVGLAQGFIEPLEATALHLVQETIEAFVQAWTEGGFGPQHRDRFNQEINARVEGVRDYIVCRYRMNTRADTPYWRDCAANERISDNLRQLLACWFQGGDLVAEIHRLGIGLWFGELSWHCLLGGYGVYPDPKTLRPPTPREFRFDVSKIAEFIDRVTLNFPSHEQALAELENASG